MTDPASRPSAAEDEGVPPLYASVQEWVEQVYAPTFARKESNELRWCAKWWLHAEAIVRFTALWRTWEAARIDPDPHVMADWIWRYLDTIMPPLLAPSGPFRSCTSTRHSAQYPPPTDEPPPDYWGEELTRPR